MPGQPVRRARERLEAAIIRAVERADPKTEARLRLELEQIEPKRPGRPTQAASEGVVRDLCEAYRHSGSIDVAAKAVGLSRETVYQWMRKAPQMPEGHPYRMAIDALRKVRAEFLLDRLREISTVEDWRAKAYLIDRGKALDEARVSDPEQEAWASLSEPEAVEAIAQDPRVIAAVQKRLAALPAQNVNAVEPSTVVYAAGAGGNE